jgi:hypothetical protein
MGWCEELVVGEGGFEPPHACAHWHLKPACLPFHHSPMIPLQEPARIFEVSGGKTARRG